MEYAHIGVGLGGTDTKKSIRIANVVLLEDSISGIRECVAQGRSVFFAMSQLIQGYIYSSSILYLFALFSVFLQHRPFVMTISSLMILAICLNYLSQLTLIQLNYHIKEKVMKQGSYTQNASLFTDNQQRQVSWSLVIFCVECLFGVALGYTDILQSISGGVIVLVHIEGISAQTQNLQVKLLGIVSGCAMIVVQKIVDGRTKSVYTLLYYYSICVVIILANQVIIKKMKWKAVARGVSPRYSIIVN